MSDEDTQQTLEYSDEVSDDEKPVLEVVGRRSEAGFSHGGWTELHAALETTQRLPWKWKKLVTVTEKTNSPAASVVPGEEASHGTGEEKQTATPVRKKRAAAREEARRANDLMECYTQHAAKSQKKTTKPPSCAASSDCKV